MTKTKKEQNIYMKIYNTIITTSKVDVTSINVFDISTSYLHNITPAMTS